MAIECYVDQHIATLAEKDGYTFELNRVSFRNYPAKLDLRRWHEGQPLRGIRFSDEEARQLLTALEGVFNGQE